MDAPPTFLDLARELGRAGAGSACLVEAAALEARSATLPPLRAEALRRAARGLRAAGRLLGRPSRAAGPLPPFRPLGLRGAIAEGHAALASDRAAVAELIGSGAAEGAPEHPAGLRLVGQALAAVGQHVLAVRALRGALAVDPDDPFTRALHAEALWFAGERGAARGALASLRAGGAECPLAAALDAAIQAGALDGVGGRP
jgi:hypothetical protein